MSTSIVRGISSTVIVTYNGDPVLEDVTVNNVYSSSFDKTLLTVLMSELFDQRGRDHNVLDEREPYESMDEQRGRIGLDESISTDDVRAVDENERQTGLIWSHNGDK